MPCIDITDNDLVFWTFFFFDCAWFCNENYVTVWVGPDPETRLENRSYHSWVA